MTHPWDRSYPAGLNWADPVLREPLFLALDRAVADYGQRPCLDFLGRSYSYAEVGALVARAAKGLQDLGVTKGSRVALFLPNTPYYVVSYFAAMKLGAIVVNVNPLYKPASGPPSRPAARCAAGTAPTSPSPR
jgi:long-chain acyl-CoA synthetase